MPAHSDKKTIDELARMLELPEYDTVRDNNEEYLMNARSYGEREAEESGEDLSEDEIAEAGYAAENKAEAALWRSWKDAVESVAERLLDEHGLVLVESKRHAGTYKISAERSWSDAAAKIMDTINGVGYFEFSSLRDFLESGPYTAREAVLVHLNSIRDRPRVYGTSTAERLYESAWREP